MSTEVSTEEAIEIQTNSSEQSTPSRNGTDNAMNEESRKRKNSLPLNNDYEYEPMTKKFEIKANEANSWELLPDLNEYIHDKFSTYLPDTDIKSHILNENPVPTYVGQASMLDDYLRALLEEKNKPKS